MKKVFSALIFCLCINNSIATQSGDLKNTETSERGFSFKSSRVCVLPAKSPPAKFFNKKYKAIGLIDGFHLDWIIIDINGDDICDWIRKGVEQEVPFTDYDSGKYSIFLGTADGWEYWEPVDNKWGTGDLYIPIGAIVYEDKERRPIFVYYQTLNARNPYIAESSFSIRQWNEQLKNLTPVAESTAVAVRQFLKKELCKSEVDFSKIIGNAKRLTYTGDGSLCGPTE